MMEPLVELFLKIKENYVDICSPLVQYKLIGAWERSLEILKMGLSLPAGALWKLVLALELKDLVTVTLYPFLLVMPVFVLQPEESFQAPGILHCLSPLMILEIGTQAFPLIALKPGGNAFQFRFAVAVVKELGTGNMMLFCLLPGQLVPAIELEAELLTVGIGDEGEVLSINHTQGYASLLEMVADIVPETVMVTVEPTFVQKFHTIVVTQVLEKFQNLHQAMKGLFGVFKERGEFKENHTQPVVEIERSHHLLLELVQALPDPVHLTSPQQMMRDVMWDH
jgi:hypothetical protein